MDVSAATAKGSAVRGVLLWAALIFAFSPVLVDLGLHLVAEAWPRPVAIFFVLLGWRLWRDGACEAARRDGYLWLAIALAIAFVAVGGGETRLGRLGIPLAVLGLCRAFGLAPLRTAAIGFWLVPVPSLLNSAVSPFAQRLWLELAAGAVNLFGAGVGVVGTSAVHGEAVLRLAPPDAGLSLVALLSGLGWYASLRHWRGLGAAAARSLRWGALALPIHALGVAAAIVALRVAGPEVARGLLDAVAWLVVVGFILGYVGLARGCESSCYEGGPDAPNA